MLAASSIRRQTSSRPITKPATGKSIDTRLPQADMLVRVCDRGLVTVADRYWEEQRRWSSVASSSSSRCWSATRITSS